MINYLREASHSTTYAASVPAPVAQQIISSMTIIMGDDGTNEGTCLPLNSDAPSTSLYYYRREENSSVVRQQQVCIIFVHCFRVSASKCCVKFLTCILCTLCKMTLCVLDRV